MRLKPLFVPRSFKAMFTLFYRNTRLLILTIILIFVWGISSYLALPRLEDPELVSRDATVKIFLPGADAARVEALSDFKQQLEDTNWQLPNGYSYEFGGEVEQKNNALGGLVSTVGVIAVLMVATLVLSLGSFRLAAIIGVVAIASFGLGLFAIWLFGYPFGFNPIIGTVGLIGVAINDSIVVLAAIQQHPIAKTGNKPAIKKVVLRSTRHVIATTSTTGVGFVPLLLGGGEFWPPLAIEIAGGVIGATLLALYLIPAAYLIVTKSKNRRFRTKAIAVH